MRMVMYLSLVVVSILPFPVILFLLPNISISLLVSGAAELAFAFYAFTSGNTAYSMVPALKHRIVRREVLKRSVNMIGAGRVISLGAVLLLCAGIVAGACDPTLVWFLLLSLDFIAALVVVYGSFRLWRNISFVSNDYLESGRLKDYHFRT